MLSQANGKEMHMWEERRERGCCYAENLNFPHVEELIQNIIME